MSGSAISDDDLVKTKDILDHGGISRQMFYTYLNIGLIRPAKILENGHRLFDKDIYRRLALIQILRDKDYALKEIKDTWKGLGNTISVDEENA